MAFAPATLTKPYASDKKVGKRTGANEAAFAGNLIEEDFMFGTTTSVFALALLSVVGFQGKDQEHPVVGLVKAAVKDTAKPFTLVVRMKVKEGKAKEYESLFAKVAKESRKEKGNRAYDMNRSAKVANEYLIYEKWENLAALEFHLKTPHFVEAAANSGAFADGPPEIVIMVPIGD